MPNTKQKKILLVEDEAILAITEKSGLEKYGYNVITVNSGEKAIDIICTKKEPIDLILMDIDLGNGKDGTETAHEILKNNNIPVLFLSSHTEKEIVEKTEKITSYGYVVKNSSFTVLDASIKMAFKLFESNYKLHESLNHINAIFESTADLIWTVDPVNFGIINYNQSFYNYFLNKRNILIKPGMRPKDLFPSNDFIQKWEAYYQNAIKDGSFHIEYQSYSGTNTLDLTINIVKVGNVIESLSVFGKDITIQNNFKTEIIKSEEKFMKAFNFSPAAMSINDLSNNNIFVDCNESFVKITGYKKEEIIGKNAEELELYAEPEKRNELIALLEKDGEVINYKHKFKNKNKEIFDCFLSLIIVEINSKPHLLVFQNV